MNDNILETTCCIAGGGPAGVMLGYLLAREGVRVTVLEKHKDFFRDFRGDTVHPSTLDLIDELGLLEEFLEVPHQKVTSLGGVFGDFHFQAANFKHLPTKCKFVALMPQWDFLDFFAQHAKRLAGFQIRMEHEVIGLIQEPGRVAGVQVRGPHGEMSIRADLVVGCDGRHSITRKAAGLETRQFGVPIDVLWFRIGREPGDPEDLFGNVNYGKALVLINRGDYFQGGFIIRKGSFEDMRANGLSGFRESVRQVAPYLGDRVEELRDWDQVKLLTVQVNRLTRWHRPGLLCIGDAAHAMSPAGGVGINLAIQDAVAAANLLARPLLEGNAGDNVLAKVQRRRMLPTKITQRMQVTAHKGLKYVFSHPGRMRAPWQMRLAVRVPGLQTAIAYTVGVGIRPEHIPGRRKRRPVWARFVMEAIAVCTGLASGIAVTLSHITAGQAEALQTSPKGSARV